MPLPKGYTIDQGPKLPAGYTLDAPSGSPASLPESSASAAPPPPPVSFLKGVQNSFDTNTRRSPSEPLLQTGLKSVVGTFGSPFVHPISTAKGMLDMIPDSPDLPLPKTHDNPLVERGMQAYTDAKDNGLAYSGTKLAGEAFGSLALDGLVRGAPRTAGAVGDTASAIRNAAAGNPDVAALRGLGIRQGSKQALSTLRSVEGSRPFLQGSSDLADLQARVPTAKSEIWSPYENALNRVGETKTKLGTVRDLEARRLELSGQLRLLKSRNPGDIALAAQQGLDKAALMAEEKSVTSVLDPVLRDAGINPTAIRKSYGDVGRIGSRIEGKSTIVEKPQPYGFGRIYSDFSIKQPQKILGSVAEGAKDLVAGRPLWSGKATDVAIREGFRTGGPRPNFRTTPFSPQATKPAGYLEANNIMEPGGEDFTSGGIPNRPAIVPPAPPTRLGLPMSTGAGDVQPMIGVRRTPPPGFAEDYARTRIAEPEYLSPAAIPPRGYIVDPQGGVRGNPLFLEANEPRGLLGAPARRTPKNKK